MDELSTRKWSWKITIQASRFECLKPCNIILHGQINSGSSKLSLLRTKSVPYLHGLTYLTTSTSTSYPPSTSSLRVLGTTRRWLACITTLSNFSRSIWWGSWREEFSRRNPSRLEITRLFARYISGKWWFTWFLQENLLKDWRWWFSPQLVSLGPGTFARGSQDDTADKYCWPDDPEDNQYGWYWRVFVERKVSLLWACNSSIR